VYFVSDYWRKKCSIVDRERLLKLEISDSSQAWWSISSTQETEAGRS
jgi:hypothetical protein